MSEWISVKDRLPPPSFIESDADADPYEACPVLFYVKTKGRDSSHDEVLVGSYEEEVLFPFPSIRSFTSWNGNNSYHLNEDSHDVTHWMPLPEPPE